MSNGEGGLRAPVRDIVAWQDEDYWDEEKLDEETRRQFDVCHGCRRCFNLCDSFPKLFDLIDESETYELLVSFNLLEQEIHKQILENL